MKRNLSIPPKTLMLTVAIFIASLVAANFFYFKIGDAAAHNFSIDFKWDYPNVTPKLEGRQTFGFTSQLCAAAPDMSNGTDLNFPTCGWSGCDASCKAVGDILHFYGDYGVQPWRVYSDPWWWSGGGALACSSYPSGSLTGNCNTTDHKSTFASVYWNSQSAPDFCCGRVEQLVRHETLHAFGLAHPPCTTKAVMRPTGCGSFIQTLQDHDRTDLTGKY